MDMTAKEVRTRTAVGTLDRAVAILDAVEAGVRRLGQIAEVSGLTHPTAHRLVRALEEHGFLARYPGFGYRLGPRLLRLASEAMRERSTVSWTMGRS